MTATAATAIATRPADCPRCGARDAFVTVDLTDFGPATGTLCAACGRLLDARG